ncbi:MAG: hypothetical protein PVJ53_14055 [Desulfobacterales bacterium]|jgi:hypothetical protein
MSKSRQSGYAGKHPESTILDERLAAALKDQVTDGRISCAAAHAVAQTLARRPEDIGQALDLMEIRLIHCQLGLFGYQPQKRIVTKAKQWDDALESSIRDALQNGRLSCADAWSIARRQKMPRLKVAGICEALEIKIKPCQLGAF